jgi:P-type Ca2+ transporter type 2C
MELAPSVSALPEPERRERGAERAPERGLEPGEAARRLAEVGPNALPEAPPTPVWRRLLRQLKSPLLYILAFALAFDLGVWAYQGFDGPPIESIMIALVLVLNAVLGALQEHRSERALAQLKALAAPRVWVLRGGHLTAIPSHELVPGDVARVEAGDRVPADGALLSGQGIVVDESVLTGESAPVDKSQDGELLSGTLLVRGSGFLRVARTGLHSSMGKLAAMLGGIDATKTPLERRLDVFGMRIAIAIGGLAVVLVVAGLAAEGVGHINDVLLFAIALAVAAVPEGLPAVITLTLALGVQRMARRKAVIRRLAAVESLGSVTTIATDKTGTLTENHMMVRHLDVLDPDEAMLAMVLVNDADLGTGAGDPMELGLLRHADGAGFDVGRARRELKTLGTKPFDSAWKYMRVTVDIGVAAPRSYFKGAPEVLLARAALSEEERARWMEKAELRAAEGHRVLALARSEGELAEAEEGTVELIGLVSMWDPPRAEVPSAVHEAQDAGIRVLMITGDHPATARAVANAVGIAPGGVVTGAEVDGMDDAQLASSVREAHVFARVRPEHKLRIVEALQRDGQIVAMTGDGVNDAPALKRADVGVAMGLRGSDVAREVADLVLLDDNFATIVAAVEEGRSIYENILKFIRFMFSTNVALVLLVLGGAVGAWALGLRDEAGLIMVPLTAVQLLWINFVADGPPALALGLDRNPGVMDAPPRAPESSLLDSTSVRFILLTGALKAAAGGLLLVTLPLRGASLAATRTVVFLFEAAVQLFFAFPSRRTGRRAQLNPLVLIAVIGGVSLQVVAMFIPALRTALGLVPLSAEAWIIVAVAVFSTWLFSELVGALVRAIEPKTPRSKRRAAEERAAQEEPVAPPLPLPRR